MRLNAEVDIVRELNPPFKSPAELINRLLPNIFLLAGIIMFGLLVAGGFVMIQGAAAGQSEQTGRGKQAVTYAIIGFILIFASYWVVKLLTKITDVPIL